MQRYVIAPASLTLLVSAAVSPALAAEFWVAQDPATRICKVVEEIPDRSFTVMIGASSYATKDEAKAGKKAAQNAGVRKGQK